MSKSAFECWGVLWLVAPGKNAAMICRIDEPATDDKALDIAMCACRENRDAVEFFSQKTQKKVMDIALVSSRGYRKIGELVVKHKVGDFFKF